MITTGVDSFFVNIYSGLREGYQGTQVRTLDEVASFCIDFASRAGLGVSISPTTFVYGPPGAQEPGVIIGLINYPRFPSHPETVRAIALDLAQRLREYLKQIRVTVACSDTTYLIEQPK